MPYELKEIKGATGYKRWKVCKKDDMNKCFSNEPLTKTRAKSQMKALYASERRNSPRGRIIVVLVKGHGMDEEKVKKEVAKLSDEEARLVEENL